jgi:methylenetetrahydrofolate reductase (NADPH)
MALTDTLKAKQFAIIAEMETPKGVDVSDFVANARHLKGRVTAVLVPDMGYAVMRLSALAGAVLLKEQGLEPIVQFSCRDRNRLALQSDLLGSHLLGVTSVMAVAGEPVEMGDNLEAKPINDLDPKGFIQAAATLASGKDLGGKPLKGAPSFCLGARIEPWADSAEAAERIGEAKAAVDKGAQFLVTPPVFDVDALNGFLGSAGDLGAPVIGSVLLLKSVGMARYLNQNLKGVEVSEDIIRRIRAASDRPAECVKIAAETVKGLQKICGGALLITTGWEDRLSAILDQAGF